MKKLTVADAKGAADAGGLRLRSGASGGHHGQVPALRPRVGCPHAERRTGQGHRLRQQSGHGRGAHLLRQSRPEGQGGQLAFGNPGGLLRAEASRRHLPRVVVLRLGQEERSRHQLQGGRALPCGKACPGAGASSSRGRIWCTRTARTSRSRGSSSASSATPRTTWNITRSKGFCRCGPPIWTRTT